MRGVSPEVLVQHQVATDSDSAVIEFSKDCSIYLACFDRYNAVVSVTELGAALAARNAFSTIPLRI
jgi:hypothetical protein